MSSSPEPKPQFTAQYSEHPSEHERPSSQTTTVAPSSSTKLIRFTKHAQFGLSLLALLSSLVILGTSADALAVYNTTHLTSEFFLPLWPNDFNLKPTIALIVCGVIIFLANAVFIIFSRLPSNYLSPLLTHLLTLTPPLISLIASLISTSFFYGYNASSSTWTLRSWSCQWKAVSMTSNPHWGKLCAESETGVDLMVMLLVVEGLVLGLAASGLVMKRRGSEWRQERKGSPVMA
jgi:hypothetical protein